MGVELLTPASRVHPSWRPTDLSEVLSGNYAPLKPTIGRRSDGLPLLYAGKTHMLSAEPEAGKTWLALLLCHQEMEKGNKVLYLDFEDDAPSIVGRLLAMGARADMVHRLFTYVRPEVPLEDGTALVQLADSLTTLCIIDGVTEAMSLEDLSIIDNQAVADFFSRLPVAISRTGPAVLLLDHEVKRSQDRNRFSLGAGHKLAAINGASFKLQRGEPFGVGLTGTSTLQVVKDKPGYLRRHAVSVTDATIGTLVVRSEAGDFADVSIVPASDAAALQPDRRSAVMSELWTKLAAHPEGLANKTAAKNLIARAAQVKTDALNSLIEDGFVSEQAPFKTLKTYPPEDSPGG